MRIIVDAFGGDNAPFEILKGAFLASTEFSNHKIVLSGNAEKIREVAAENEIDISKMEIINAESTVEMDDHPDVVIKSKKDSSMAVGLKALANGEGDAFVSAGSTGALVIGSTFIAKRIKGVKRAALAPLLPTDDGKKTGQVMLIDSGANVECRPEILLQFGVMGYYYMKNAGIENPRVALLNVGTEDTKGGEIQQKAFELMKSADINFIGNVEARDVLCGVCDVLVCDGFSGNVLLKMCEGTVGVVMSNLKAIFMQNIFTKLCYLVLKPGLKAFKKKLDYTEAGGAALMGIAHPVIKAHGSSNAKAIKNAIRQAIGFAEGGAIMQITDTVAALKEKESNDAQA